MRVIDEYGNKIDINDNDLPPGMMRYLYAGAQLIPDGVKLSECFVATLFHKDFDTGEYKYVDEEMYDKFPTEEKILVLMTKNKSLRDSYVSIQKAYTYKS